MHVSQEIKLSFQCMDPISNVVARNAQNGLYFHTVLYADEVSLHHRRMLVVVSVIH